MLPSLNLALFDGKAFVGVVPFRIEHVTARFFPDIPSAFPELNVRVYVEVGGVGGVYFFSLDATQALAIWGARTFFRLNYLKARMALEYEGAGVDDEAIRLVWEATIEPLLTELFFAEPDRLDAFSLERLRARSRESVRATS